MNENLVNEDVVKGNQGKALITLDGRVYEFGAFTDIVFNADLSLETFEVVGATLFREGQPVLSGSFTLHPNTTKFANIVDDILKGRPHPPMDLQIVNEDTGSNRGRQVITYFGCKLSGTIQIARLNTSTETFTVNFNANRMEINEPFTQPRAGEL